MLTLFISLFLSAGTGASLHFAAAIGLGWSIAAAVFVFFLLQFIAGRIIQKRLMAEMEAVQAILLEGRKKLEAKMQRWQMRPPGSIQAAQKEISDDTRVFVLAALDQTEALRKFKLWVPMIERQMATAQLQLNWMIKDFKKVDELFPKVIFADPTLVAMKLARMQMKDESVEEMRKVYEKGARRLKYNQNVLLAGTYSWILVKRGDADGAFKVLTEALKSSDNETLKKNHESLMNNRIAHFNNSGLGDAWYQLFLEEPKVRMQRPRSVYR